jgi:hypothetical protein
VGDTTDLAQRLEGYLRGRGEVTEGRVLDGRGFFLDGRLVAAVTGEDLCLEVGREEWQRFLADEGVRPLRFADLAIPGWILVDGASLVTDDDLGRWIEEAIGRW